jgi:antitoxin MazE
MRVAKWGNSLAIRLPAPVVKVLDLKAGDEIEVRVTGAGDLEIDRKPSRQEIVERLRQFRGMMPADFKFDRDEANAR